MVKEKKLQLYAEAYGMGDVMVGRKITGVYPNAPADHCSLGVGCDETGICYALYHNQPEQCGRRSSVEPRSDVSNPPKTPVILVAKEGLEPPTYGL